MRIITYQAKEVIDILLKEGSYKVTDSKMMKTYISFKWRDDDFNPFKEAYDYIINRMKKLIDNIDLDDDIIAPIWGWYKYKSINKLNKDNPDLYRIELEIDEKRVLLSDFYIYEDIAVGGLSYIFEGNDDMVEKYLHAEDEVVFKFYDKMLNLDKAEYIQATFWKLKLENVKSIKKVSDLKTYIYKKKK